MGIVQAVIKWQVDATDLRFLSEGRITHLTTAQSS